MMYNRSYRIISNATLNGALDIRIRSSVRNFREIRTQIVVYTIDDKVDLNLNPDCLRLDIYML